MCSVKASIDEADVGDYIMSNGMADYYVLLGVSSRVVFHRLVGEMSHDFIYKRAPC